MGFGVKLIIPTFTECALNWGCKCQDSKNNTYNCLRALNDRENTLFCMFDDQEGSVEMYNLQLDPYQLHNLMESGSWYANRLQELTTCKGHHDCNNDLVNEIEI